MDTLIIFLAKVGCVIAGFTCFSTLYYFYNDKHSGCLTYFLRIFLFSVSGFICFALYDFVMH